jgi:hypothetical protein
MSKYYSEGKPIIQYAIPQTQTTQEDKSSFDILCDRFDEVVKDLEDNINQTIISFSKVLNSSALIEAPNENKKEPEVSPIEQYIKNKIHDIEACNYNLRNLRDRSCL